MYLNSIYFGNNIFGIKSASSFYFDKKVEDLKISESAILSGLISAPSVYNPINNLKVAKDKGQMVVSLMKKEGYTYQCFTCDEDFYAFEQND